MKRRPKILLYALLALPLFFAAIFIPAHLFATEQQSVWFKDSSLEFSVRKDTVASDKYPTTYGGRGNIDCSNLTLKKRDGVILDTILKLYKESSITGCYINSPVGPVDTNGYVNVSGTDYAAEVVNSNGQPTSHMVFPGSDMFISSATASPAVGAYVWFDHLQSSMTLLNMPNGKILAGIKPTHQVSLTDKAGNKLPVMADNFSISDNGEWLVVDSPGHGILRINLTTMEVVPFTNSFELGNGIGAALRTAISSDGRFAVVASKNYNFFKLFDLSTCTAVPNVITAPVGGCKSLELNSFARSKINDMSSVLHVRFLTDELIKFYASYDVSTSSRIGEFVIAAPGTYLTGMDYLALGDSYTSGEGAHKYEIGTDDEDINMCHLSKVSYPYIIADKLQANLFHSVACSGARTVNVRGGTGESKDKSKKDRDNQYYTGTRPSNDPLGIWAPGYKKQIGFVSVNNPKIITLSAGGNDVGFDDKLKACLKPGTCYPSYEDRQEIFNEIDGKLATLTDTFKKTKEYATKNARIYIIGYPQIALPTGNCGLNVHLNEDELTLAASIITRLNTVMKTAATNAEVNYVDIEDALSGYRLCENDAGNIAMNGLTAGKDILDILGNESYHPNQFGHELIAAKILGATNNLGNIDPIMVAVKVPKISDNDASLKKAPKTNRALKKKVTASVAPKTAKKGKTTKVSVKGVDHGLTPNTNCEVVINGNSVATTATNESGDIDTDITIPENTETGPATIGVTCTDVTGQPVDIGGVIDIGNDGPDFDDDGIPDTDDSCPAITNALVDVDQDGIDDACDPSIGPAPVQPPADPDPITPDPDTPPNTPEDQTDPDQPPDSDTNPITTPPTPTETTTQTPATPTQTTETDTTPTDTTSSQLVETNQTSTNTETNDTFLQGLPLQDDAEEADGQVLGTETDEPSTPFVQEVATTAKESLQDQASTHPIAFLSIVLGLMLSLSGLWKLHHKHLSKTYYAR
jgi:lysophospholipase L1-like esterase